MALTLAPLNLNINRFLIFDRMDRTDLNYRRAEP